LPTEGHLAPQHFQKGNRRKRGTKPPRGNETRVGREKGLRIQEGDGLTVVPRKKKLVARAMQRRGLRKKKSDDRGGKEKMGRGLKGGGEKKEKKREG